MADITLCRAESDEGRESNLNCNLLLISAKLFKFSSHLWWLRCLVRDLDPSSECNYQRQGLRAECRVRFVWYFHTHSRSSQCKTLVWHVNVMRHLMWHISGWPIYVANDIRWNHLLICVPLMSSRKLGSILISLKLLQIRGDAIKRACCWHTNGIIAMATLMVSSEFNWNLRHFDWKRIFFKIDYFLRVCRGGAEFLCWKLMLTANVIHGWIEHGAKGEFSEILLEINWNKRNKRQNHSKYNRSPQSISKNQFLLNIQIESRQKMTKHFTKSTKNPNK